jgi:hypothetical protein
MKLGSVLTIVTFLATPLTAQLAVQPVAQLDRITVAIESSGLVKLSGAVHPNALIQNDAGPVEPTQRLGYISLLLKKTAAQQSALERLLEEQLDSSSANYHRWLTPEEYADRFGASPNDVATIVGWLQAQGLAIEATARGRD